MGRLFGTDGVRGIANKELTCELALHIGRATASVLTDGSRRRPVFVVGTDTRASSDMLAAALMAGLCSVGADVYALGVIPTPAVAYLVGKYKADAGIMISASHNPAEYNGIKIFSGDGYKLPDALEEQIEAIVLDHVLIPAVASGDGVGKIMYPSQAVKDYVDHLKSTVAFSLSGLKIAVDCANGAASETAKKLFSELHAECHILFDKPNGVNINDNCGSTYMQPLQQYVVENGLDAGVAFDGDADRCLCVDNEGNLVDGDRIMAICASDLHSRGKLAKDTVVGTILTNLGFIKFCKDTGLNFVATKVGDRYVLEEMQLEEYSFGGEQSGHVIFKDFATTGDGQLTAIQLLSILKRRESKLSDLTHIMTPYPQLMINLKTTAENKLKFYTDKRVKEAIEESKKVLGDEGRVVVRPSGTEPLIRVMAEGSDLQMIEAEANKIAEVLCKQLGCE